MGLGCFPFHRETISRNVTPNHSLSDILSLIEFSKLSPPSSVSALPSVMLIEASPKAISERTSSVSYTHLDVYKRQLPTQTVYTPALKKPVNYFPNDDIKLVPKMNWKSAGNLIFSNWLNYFEMCIRDRPL